MTRMNGDQPIQWLRYWSELESLGNYDAEKRKKDRESNVSMETFKYGGEMYEIIEVMLKTQ